MKEEDRRAEIIGARPSRMHEHKHFSDTRLFDFNSISPDFVFKIGDVREGLMAMGRSVGLDAEQMKKLEARARVVEP